MKNLGITKGDAIVSEIQLKDWSTCCSVEVDISNVCNLFIVSLKGLQTFDFRGA